MSWFRERPRIFGTLVGGILVVLVTARTVSESRAELVTADDYEERGEVMRALEHYRRAMRWTFPLNP